MDLIFYNHINRHFQLIKKSESLFEEESLYSKMLKYCDYYFNSETNYDYKYFQNLPQECQVILCFYIIFHRNFNSDAIEYIDNIFHDNKTLKLLMKPIYCENIKGFECTKLGNDIIKYYNNSTIQEKIIQKFHEILKYNDKK